MGEHFLSQALGTGENFTRWEDLGRTTGGGALLDKDMELGVAVVYAGGIEWNEIHEMKNWCWCKMPWNS